MAEWKEMTKPKQGEETVLTAEKASLWGTRVVFVSVKDDNDREKRKRQKRLFLSTMKNDEYWQMRLGTRLSL